MLERVRAEGKDPLDFLLRVMSGDPVLGKITLDQRLYAAAKACPYLHAALKTVELKNADGDTFTLRIRRE